MDITRTNSIALTMMPTTTGQKHLELSRVNLQKEKPISTNT